MNKSSLELEKICNETVALAIESGKFILQEAAHFDLTRIEHKGTNDLVSYVDKETEKKLVAGLSQILPEAGFITEEGTIEQTDKKLRWVIDPLDGTTNFLHGLPTYSISIALLDGEEILLGVVYEMNLKECFYAWKDGGAYCNGKRIKASGIHTLKESLVATGFPYSLLGRQDAYFEILKNMTMESHGLRRLGSAAIDLAYVACGRFEGYFEFNLHIWDIAAGILLVKESGGVVTDFSGGDQYLYGQELLAAGAAHAEIKEVILRHW